MYGNNYPNDYDNKNVVGSTGKEGKSEGGNFSGQNTSAYYADYNNNAGTTEKGNYQYENYGGSQTGYASSDSTYGGSYNRNQPPKKEKKPGKAAGYFKKALAAVSFGLFFGVCAGIGFFAVESAANNSKGAGAAAESADENTAKAVGELSDNTGNTIDSTDIAQTVVMDVSDVAEEVMPAIVSINNTYTQTMSYFGQTLANESTSVGSGIIVGESDSELLIVSNYHVIQDADKLVIQFVDGSEAEAQMKGSDPNMDLAVIAVSLDNVETVTKEAIVVASLGDSDSLTVGEPAIAIGNALGYGQSVTVGVISALNRVIDLSSMETGIVTDSGEGEAFIQTDAAINPGNSGGALLNINGEVIGINSNKIGGTAIEGMGYAIPISAAKPIIEELMLKETRAKVSEDNKGYLGISQLTVVDEMAEAYGMPKGVYVSQVHEGTAAEAAGIMKGNVITEFDGNAINSSEDLLRVMQYYSEGDTVEVTVMQGSPDGWESKSITLTLGGKFE